MKSENPAGAARGRGLAGTVRDNALRLLPGILLILAASALLLLTDRMQRTAGSDGAGQTLGAGPSAPVNQPSISRIHSIQIIDYADAVTTEETHEGLSAELQARGLTERGDYDPDAALQAYQFWLDSDPFDCGMTIATSLRGRPNPDSQANGAMMRISPLGIFGANHPLETVGKWARQDAALTHPNPVCLQANSLFTMAIAHAIASGCEAENLYQNIKQWAADLAVDPALMDAIHGAAKAPPEDYVQQQGWVLIAFRNALWQLLNAPSLEAGVADTVMRGGDTDTNAAICGALLGAVYGLDAIPAQWVDRVLNCRPKTGHPGVNRPRPECFWPVDALKLTERLIGKQGPLS